MVVFVTFHRRIKMATTKMIELITRSLIQPRKDDDNGGGMIWKNRRKKMKEQQQ